MQTLRLSVSLVITLSSTWQRSPRLTMLQCAQRQHVWWLQTVILEYFCTIGHRFMQETPASMRNACAVRSAAANHVSLKIVTPQYPALSRRLPPPPTCYFLLLCLNLLPEVSLREVPSIGFLKITIMSSESSQSFGRLKNKVAIVTGKLTGHHIFTGTGMSLTHKQVHPPAMVKESL